MTKGRARPISHDWKMTVVLILAVTVAFAWVPSVPAQVPAGTIEGTISDSSGAVVRGASVTAKNVATGSERKTASNDIGFYSLPLLPIGGYELTIEKSGFKKKLLQGVTLKVDQIARIDVTLDVGGPQEQVTATVLTPLVDTANASIGEVIENRRVVDLPLNGRNFLQLALLAGGTAPSPQGGAHQQWATNCGGFGVDIAGQRETQNNFNLDGVTNVEEFINTMNVCPSVDAIQEFRVQENSYPPDGGVFSGAQINVTTKSGTNDLHGTVYEFFRNSALDAKNFFDDPTQPIPQYKQNQFGAALGGPIRKDRTFFFLNYEGLRIRRSITNLTVLPTAAMHAGDLSGINPASGQLFPPIIDPTTGQPFRGNMIPTSRFDPLSAAILNLLPLPNLPGGIPFNNRNVGRHNQDVDEFVIRLDHQLNSRNLLFGRFAFQNDKETFPFVPNIFAFNPPAPPGFGDVMIDHGRNLALGHTSIISPTLVNDFRFGFNRFRGSKEGENIGRGFIQALGFQRGGPTVNFGIPAIVLPGFADIGDSDIFQPINRLSNIVQFLDTAVWTQGRHSQKFGVDLRRIQRRDLVEDFSQGLFLFSDGTTVPTVTGSAFSDFLLGRPFLSFSFAGNSLGYDRSNYLALRYNDEFHVTRRFTVNFGLRYEFMQAPGDRFAHQSIGNPMNSNQFFVRTQNGQLPPQVNDPLNQLFVKNFGFQFVPSDSAGLPAALVNTDYRRLGGNFAPRIGLAWDIFGKGQTVVRAAYGIYNAIGQLDYAIETRQSPPFVSFPFGVDLNRFAPAFFAPLTYQQAFLSGNMAPQFLSTLPNLHNGYVHQWSFDVQQQLTPNMALRLQYVGSTGLHLTERTISNQPLPNLPNQRRGKPPFPGQEYFSRATDSTSSYQGFVARLERRLSGGLLFVGAYTFSKSLDTASTLQGAVTLPQDSYNLGAERGRSDFDIRQRFVLSALWNLPFGPGKRWIQSGAASRILGGFQMGGILTLETGQPTTAQLSSSNAGTGNNAAVSARPDRVGDPFQPGPVAANPTCVAPTQLQTPTHWFNPCAFALPPTFTDANGQFSIPGNAGRNIIDGPGFNNMDFTIQKSTTITERHQIIFRAEFFNLTNHPNFDLPGRTLGTATFGAINSAKSARLIQFSLRYSF